MPLDHRSRMDWRDLDFILSSPECERTTPVERTGWETVVFELEDEERLPERRDYFGSDS